jgi:membrane protease YdiL (CAAX protease family)
MADRSNLLKSAFTSLARYAAPVRLLTLLALLLLVWLPLALPIAWFIDDPNTETIVTMSLLFVEFLLLIRLWGRLVHQDAHIFQTYGLGVSQQNGLELAQGLSLGCISVLVLFLVQGGLGWLTWQPTTITLIQIVLEGLVVALGVGFAEELVFRGWILDELQRDYSPALSLWLDSLIFACLHFIKPISEILRTFPQFPGLVLLGLALVWAKRSTRSKQWSTRTLSIHQGRLGLSIGLHAGLVWGNYIVVVGQLINYSDRVPPWVTGIDQNPLAGLIGLLFLSALAGLMWRRSRLAAFR